MRDRTMDMDIDDFVFLAFSCGAKLIHKQLTDKRLTSKRYVADRRWMADLDPIKYGEKAKDDVTCWFNVPYNTKRSIPLETWASECEKTGLRWEIRQEDKTHYTVFLMMNEEWHYDKQIRSFETMCKESL